MKEQVIDIDGKILTRVVTDQSVTYYNAQGQRHRVGGPAYTDLEQEIYIVNDKYHNLDGAAIYLSDGSTEFWVNNTQYQTLETYEQAVKHYKFTQNNTLKP